MAVSKNIGKQSKGNGRKKHTPTPGTTTKPVTVLNTVKNTDPVRTAQNCAVLPLQKIDTYTIPDPVKTAIISPVIPLPKVDSYAEPVLTEVVSYPTPKTIVMAHKGPTMRGVLIGVAGGSIAGYVAYTGLKSVFLDKGYTADQANQYAIYSGVAVGLLTFALLYRITKN
jgi:hypothetical protein